MPARLTLYGIPNCDTVKRARAWLTDAGIDHCFHDFKRAGVPAAALQHWIAVVGWEALLNRRGTTWRGLSAAAQAAVVDAASAAALMGTQPSVIKRPVMVLHTPDSADAPHTQVLVGFDPQRGPALLHAALQGA